MNNNNYLRKHVKQNKKKRKSKGKTFKKVYQNETFKKV